MTDLNRLKLSAVGDWKRRTTSISRAVFSYALRVCLASLSWPDTPARTAPFASPRESYGLDPGRAVAIYAGSIVDGDPFPEAWLSGGEVFNAAVRCSQSFCWVRDGGSEPGGLVGGEALGFCELGAALGDGGVLGW